ncbi:MAG: glycosyltransferase family 39 protein [Candidatus Omnitrophica bacterium]|nr:glycosyltransferase family 39 protein [Candidatus Omnitrophota bacterium]
MKFKSQAFSLTKKIAFGIVFLVILILNVLRFWKLDTIPYGYHVDEVGSAVTIQCFVEKGCDAELRVWPLFGRMEYGQDKPPTYVYPGILWAKIFGTTVPSLRAFSVFILLIGILGLFFLAKKIFGLEAGLVVALAATCSPWGWVMNRVALESFGSNVFLIWGLYFFLRSNRWWDWVLAALFFAGAMYSYPPARFAVPCMLLTLSWFESKNRPIRFSLVLSLGFVFIIALIPLVLGYKYDDLGLRFHDIGIFNKAYLSEIGKTGTPRELISIFVHNYLLHLTPDFLFLTGDPSLIHSTGHLGILGWLDISALFIFFLFFILALLKPAWQENPVIKHRRWLIFLALNFFIGIIPAALTFQELPHALRVSGSWLFMMLFTGLMWAKAGECLKAVWPALALAAILSGGVLVWQYFTLYPQESKGMFTFWVMDQANRSKSRDEWMSFLMLYHRQNYHCRYFLSHKLGMSCKEANDVWWDLYHRLKKAGLY